MRQKDKNNSANIFHHSDTINHREYLAKKKLEKGQSKTKTDSIHQRRFRPVALEDHLEFLSKVITRLNHAIVRLI